MKNKISLFCALFLLITIFSNIQVNAFEVIDEDTKTTTETTIEEIETVETTQDTMTDTELLKQINNHLLGIEWILIFMIFIHYADKWLKVSLEMINREGKVK